MKLRAYLSVYSFTRENDPASFYVSNYPWHSPPLAGELRYIVTTEVPDQAPALDGVAEALTS